MPVTRSAEYLLTWNCKHIAKLMQICAAKLRDCAVHKAMNQPTSVPQISSGTTLRDDPIVDEVRQVRDRYLAAFDYDLQALFEDIRCQEVQSDVSFVSYPARSVLPTESAR